MTHFPKLSVPVLALVPGLEVLLAVARARSSHNNASVNTLTRIGLQSR